MKAQAMVSLADACGVRLGLLATGEEEAADLSSAITAPADVPSSPLVPPITKALDLIREATRTLAGDEAVALTDRDLDELALQEAARIILSLRRLRAERGGNG